MEIALATKEDAGEIQDLNQKVFFTSRSGILPKLLPR